MDTDKHNDIVRGWPEYWQDEEQRNGLLSFQVAFELIDEPMNWPVSMTQLLRLLTAMHYEVDADLVARWIAIEQVEEPPRENGQYQFEPKHAEAIRSRLHLDERWRPTPSRWDELKTPVRLTVETAMAAGQIDQVDHGLRQHDVADLLAGIVNATDLQTRRTLRDLVWGRMLAAAVRLQAQATDQTDDTDVFGLGLDQWRELQD